MKVLFTASEIHPLMKTGGLADVTGALPEALHRAKVDVRLLMPAYRGTADAAAAKPVASLGDFAGRGEVRILEGRLPGNGLPLWLIDNPALYDREGEPYLDAAKNDWADNDMRFGLLGWAAARLAQAGTPLGWVPDIVHAHDWQTGLTPAYLRAWGETRPKVVFTIHNMAYQGIFPAELLPRLGLPWSSFTLEGLEYWGKVSYLKAALVYSDKLTTVSPTYAHDIQGPALGFGMQGILAQRAGDLVGILNGADYRVWNPADDKYLAKTYKPDEVVAGKAANKAAIQAQLGLPVEPEAPLLVVISRLNDQKGMDLLLAVMPTLLAEGAQLAVLGTGDLWMEEALTSLSRDRPNQVAVHIGYSEELAHRLQAGGDMLLMPSRFEPCGLTQIYALRYGTLPVAHRTGGLADTVVNASYDTLLTGTATGFVFEVPTASAFQWCIERAIALYRHPDQWRRLQACAVRQDFGWDRGAAQYLGLYRGLLDGGAGKPRARRQNVAAE